MTKLIPALGACAVRMTAGERGLAERLEQNSKATLCFGRACPSRLSKRSLTSSCLSMPERTDPAGEGLVSGHRLHRYTRMLREGSKYRYAARRQIRALSRNGRYINHYEIEECVTALALINKCMAGG